MKKYKVYLESYFFNSDGTVTWYFVIELDCHITIESEDPSYFYKSKSSAKRAANNVAKKLGIGLEWEK